MLKSELGHSVLMRREEKPEKPGQNIPCPQGVYGRLARARKAVHTPSVGRVPWKGESRVKWLTVQLHLHWEPKPHVVQPRKAAAVCLFLSGRPDSYTQPSFSPSHKRLRGNFSSKLLKACKNDFETVWRHSMFSEFTIALKFPTSISSVLCLTRFPRMHCSGDMRSGLHWSLTYGTATGVTGTGGWELATLVFPIVLLYGVYLNKDSLQYYDWAWGSKTDANTLGNRKALSPKGGSHITGKLCERQIYFCI